MMYSQVSLAATDVTHVGQVRRQAARLAQTVGMSEYDGGRVTIIATELATNLIHHAKAGEILVRSCCEEDVPGVELISVDRGPGMSNVVKCLEDGYSTAGTPGNGLGAVCRLSSEWDIYSTEPTGTVIYSRVYGTATKPHVSKAVEWGIVNLPVRTENVSGDTWRIRDRDGVVSVMLVDGLGHGQLAADAANIAGRVFEADPKSSSIEMLHRADAQMRGTRGAAMAIAQLTPSTGRLQFAGIGNIAGSLRSRNTTTGRGLVSHNGIVGVTMQRVQAFDYCCADDWLLVMHSDGMKSRWSFDAYPGLVHRHPAVVAGLLYRDFARGNDDVTICVVRSSTAASSND